MLPKKHRLSKHADVATTTAKGRGFFNKYFVIKFISKAEPESLAQWTVVVSAKVAKLAVARNRIKRIIRAHVQSKLDIIKPGQYALIVKKAAVTASPAEIRAELDFSLNKSKILRA